MIGSFPRIDSARLTCTKAYSLLPEWTLSALVPRGQSELWRKRGVVARPEHVIHPRSGSAAILGRDSKSSPLACPWNSPNGVRFHLDLRWFLRQVEYHSREQNWRTVEKGSRWRLPLNVAADVVSKPNGSLCGCYLPQPSVPTARFSTISIAPRFHVVTILES